MILSGKMLKAKEDEAEWLKYQLEYYKLMLDKGLEENYKKTLREYKQQRHDIETQLVMTQANINVLKSQMRDGVEVKEDVDAKEKTKGGKK